MDEKSIEKPVNTSDLQVERNEDGTIKPGFTANPNGRPKGSKNFTTIIREALQDKVPGQTFTYGEALKMALLNGAIVNKDPRLIKLIWNYLDGMPNQVIGSVDGKDITDVREKMVKLAEELGIGFEETDENGDDDNNENSGGVDETASAETKPEGGEVS